MNYLKWSVYPTLFTEGFESSVLMVCDLWHAHRRPQVQVCDCSLSRKQRQLLVPGACCTSTTLSKGSCGQHTRRNNCKPSRLQQKQAFRSSIACLGHSTQCQFSRFSVFNKITKPRRNLRM